MKADLELSIALSDNENTRPLLDGEVTAAGMKLIPTPLHPSEMFWRQLRFRDFDISEMSMSSLLIATARGPTPWVAIPIFTTREFYHTRVLVRAAAGIASPADLRGKRIGVPEYQQTAAIWARGILEHEFGVHARDMEWFMERVPEKSHGGATGFAAPPGVKVSRIPPTTNIGEMLVRGELDATLLYLRERNLVDRSKIDLLASGEFRPLFPDSQAEGHRYFAKTGLYPINHTVVVRRDLLERHPWIALNLVTAFINAKNLVASRANLYLKRFYELGLLGEDTRRVLGEDPMAYGLKAARPVLEMVAQYVHEQGLAERRVGLEEIFAPSTLDI